MTRLFRLFAVLTLCACERPATPCDRCPSFSERLVCLRETKCFSDGGCSEVEVRCAERCQPAADGGLGCSEGHACITDDRDRTYCESACRNELCSAGKECGENSCVAVECGTTIRCPAATDFCDLPSHTCKALSGVCSSLEQCQSSTRDTVVTCSGSCRLTPAPFSSVGEVAPLDVAVVSPNSTSQFSNQGDVFFEWDGLEQPSVVLVLRGEVGARPLSSAIWGAVLPAGTTRVTLAEGSAIIDGGWEPASAPALPEGEQLAFFVQQVDRRTLVARSLAVPFIVADTWAQRGEPCVSECANPFVPLSCYQGTCLARCASHVDCFPAACIEQRVCN